MTNERTTKRHAGEKLTPTEAKKVRDMLNQGVPATHVAKKLGVSITTARRIRTAEGIIGQALGKTPAAIESADQAKWFWLQKNWHFKKPIPKKKENSVQVGYKSNFHTPFRPDGVWH